MKPRLTDFDWRAVYRTGQQDLLNDFYLKALSCASSYDRAVGYFSSELLVAASQGISNLIDADGKMRLLIGSPLDDDEYSALKESQDLRMLSEQFEKSLIDLLEKPVSEIAEYRLQLMCWMLACGRLEIKFALRNKGMYHEKIGIITDCNGDKIIFQGSANETVYAMEQSLNAESISVYPSWDAKIYSDYGVPYEEAFNRLWVGSHQGVVTLDLPSDAYDRLAERYSKMDRPDLAFESEIGDQEFIDGQFLVKNNIRVPSMPKFINGKSFAIYEHQKHSLMCWKANDYKGILKLATGSGKTITAIYGAIKIFESFERLFLIVAVPYVELAKQWVANLNAFGISPHECYGGKGTWYDRFKVDIQAFQAQKQSFVAAVVVNKTLSSDSFQTLIEKVPNSYSMFIGDECHRHGSSAIGEFLPKFELRLGLSATPFQSDDDDLEVQFSDAAKDRIIEYYGPIVAEYSLAEAINDGVLTPYRYHLCPVRLSPDEQELYEDLTAKISRIVSSGVKIDSVSSQGLQMLCARRSRLIGAAEEKFLSLGTLLDSFPESERKHTLFYCAEGSPDRDLNLEDTKCVSRVSSILNQHGWRVARFTSEETSKDRTRILRSFVDGGIDALVSMKVLDEGIDVPLCNAAVILASTRNPRQYVQRRGRILRKAHGKHMSTIYDFIVLPARGYEGSASSLKMVRAELERVRDFSSLASNKKEINQHLERLGL